MKNEDLKKFLEEQVLQRDDDLTDETVLLLQDVSLHVALKRKMSMQAVASTYMVLAAGHDVMVALFGLSQVVGGLAADPALADLFGTPPRDPEKEKKEKELLDEILKDIPLDLP